MGKLILFLSFMALAFLTVGSIFMPSNPSLWWAATGDSFNLLRIGLMAILGILLVTNPPRNRAFRYFVGMSAIGLTVWSLTATYQNHMQFLDMVSILAASISMSIAALEYKRQEAWERAEAEAAAAATLKTASAAS